VIEMIHVFGDEKERLAGREVNTLRQINGALWGLAPDTTPSRIIARKNGAKVRFYSRPGNGLRPIPVGERAADAPAFR
jgi:hypothetical protein